MYQRVMSLFDPPIGRSEGITGPLEAKIGHIWAQEAKAGGEKNRSQI